MGANKYSLFPITYPALWDAYKTHQAAFWTVKDINLADDFMDIQRLTVDELHYLTHTLAFFAQADGIVNENLAVDFYRDVQIAEARAFYGDQIQREVVHAETYSLLIDAYIKDHAERNYLFNAIETIPAVKLKADWALCWIGSNADFVKRLVAFAVVEGIFFAGSFASIYWFRKRQLLPGLTTANNLIARDEGMHWQFAALLYHTLGLNISKADLYQIVMEAVSIEKEFVTEALPVDLIGINKNLMCQYIEVAADLVVRSFAQPAIYNAINPFDFMKMNDVESKTNFFERRVTNYQIEANMSGNAALDLDQDF